VAKSLFGSHSPCSSIEETNNLWFTDKKQL